LTNAFTNHSISRSSTRGVQPEPSCSGSRKLAQGAHRGVTIVTGCRIVERA
jgi:hypothetical protein